MVVDISGHCEWEFGAAVYGFSWIFLRYSFLFSTRGQSTVSSGDFFLL